MRTTSIIHIADKRAALPVSAQLSGWYCTGQAGPEQYTHHVFPLTLSDTSFFSVEDAVVAVLAETQRVLVSIRSLLAIALRKDVGQLQEKLERDGWIYGGAATGGDYHLEQIHHIVLPYALDGWTLSFVMEQGRVSISSPCVRLPHAESWSTGAQFTYDGPIQQAVETVTLEEVFRYTQEFPIYLGANYHINYTADYRDAPVLWEATYRSMSFKIVEQAGADDIVRVALFSKVGAADWQVLAVEESLELLVTYVVPAATYHVCSADTPERIHLVQELRDIAAGWHEMDLLYGKQGAREISACRLHPSWRPGWIDWRCWSVAELLELPIPPGWDMEAEYNRNLQTSRESAAVLMNLDSMLSELLEKIAEKMLDNRISMLIELSSCRLSFYINGRAFFHGTYDSIAEAKRILGSALTELERL